MSDQKISYEILLDMLGIVLIEIRAKENMAYARTMSDVFHNVPGKIIHKTPAGEIYSDMIRVAKRHDKQSYLEKLLKHSQAKRLKSTGV